MYLFYVIMGGTCFRLHLLTVLGLNMSLAWIFPPSSALLLHSWSFFCFYVVVISRCGSLLELSCSTNLISVLTLDNSGCLLSYWLLLTMIILSLFGEWDLQTFFQLYPYSTFCFHSSSFFDLHMIQNSLYVGKEEAGK